MSDEVQSALLKQSLLKSIPRIVRGSGVYLYDSDGCDYLDGSAGAMTVSIGHGVAEIVAAIERQAREICFVFRTQFSSQPAEDLATMLSELGPGDLNNVLFANSGSEATELAMRSAVQYWRERGRPTKTQILGHRTSYHGMTLGSLSMSGHSVRRRDYGNLLHAFDVGPEPNAWRRPTLDSAGRTNDPGEWIDAIRARGADNVAAIIVEPIIGAAGGVLVPPPGYLRMLRQLCDAHDVLLIADEVITGLGRTGAWFAVEHDAVVPDMLAIGKGMTSGYTPMSAVLLREHIVEAMRRGSGVAPFSHTFSGNPLSAATCLAVVRYLRDNDVLANVRARSAQLAEGLKRLSRRFRCVENVRGHGLLWGFDLGAKEGITPAAVTSQFVADCFAEGLIVYPAGLAPHSAAIVSPPLTITASETDELLRRLESGAGRFEAGK